MIAAPGPSTHDSPDNPGARRARGVVLSKGHAGAQRCGVRARCYEPAGLRFPRIPTLALHTLRVQIVALGYQNLVGSMR